jgi:TolB-like protein
MKATIRSWFRLMLLVAAAMLAAGCRTSQQTRYLHQNADLGAINKVAVLPFDTLATDRTSGDKVQKIFYIELLALDVFEVAEPGQVMKIVRASGPLDALGPADYQKIGKDLGVEGVFVGSVVDFDESRNATTASPDVTIQLRLIETQTGATIWSTSQTRSGASVGTRLFGVGGESLTEAARRVMRAELKTLLK